MLSRFMLLASMSSSFITLSAAAIAQPICQPYTIQTIWTTHPAAPSYYGMDVNNQGEAIIDTVAGPMQGFQNGILKRSPLLKFGVPRGSTAFYFAADMGPHGTIVGDFYNYGQGATHAYRYTASNQLTQDLHATTPPNSLLSQYNSSAAVDINANGDIIMNASDSGYLTQVGLVLDRNGTEHLIDPTQVGEHFLGAKMVNDLGEATGFLFDQSGALASIRPFLYQNGTLRDLGQACSTCKATKALSIDNQGTIYGHTKNGARHAIFEHDPISGFHVYDIASNISFMSDNSNELGLLFGLTQSWEQYLFANGHAYRLLDLIQGSTSALISPVVQGSSPNGDLLIEFTSASGSYDHAFLKLNQWCF